MIMKTLLSLCLSFVAFLATAQEFIDLGTAANDGTGDKMRPAGIKINTNAYNFNARLNNLQGATNGLATRVANTEAATNIHNTRLGNIEAVTNLIGSGGGEVTTAQLLVTSNQTQVASNALLALLVSYDTTTSNGLYAQIVSGGITASVATNIALYFATNSALITSNGLVSLLASYVTGPGSSVDNTLARYDSTTGKILQGSSIVVSDASAVSGLSSLSVTSGITAGGTIDGLVLRDSNFTGEKALISGVGPGAAVEESAVSDVELAHLVGVTGGIATNLAARAATTHLLSASNALYSLETTRNAAVSNALAALIIANDTTTSNALYSLISGGATAWDVIGNPSGDGTIAFAGTAQDITSTLDNAAKSYVLQLTDTDTDLANNTDLLRLVHYDTADANGFYARFQSDGGGAPVDDYLFGQTLFQIDPAIPFAPLGGFTAGSTNIIHSRTEDQAPATNDLTLVEDMSAGQLKKVALGNYPVSAGQAAADLVVSNAVVALELTRNAAVSNALAALLVANDTTTSNGLYSVETTRNAAVSNALASLLVANDTTTSNALYSLISSGSTNYLLLNASRQIITNHLDRLEVTYSANTNIIADWGATNAIIVSPSNTFTISMTGTPPTGMARDLSVMVINTNSTAGYFPTNDLNGAAVYMLPAPSTNNYTFRWRGGRFWIVSHQQAETGTNAYMRTRTGVRRSLVVPAGYIKTNTTQGAIAGTDESGSNKIQRDYLDFDEAANTNANFSIAMPIAWNRDTVRVSIHWTSTNSATAGVVWKVASNATSDGDAVDSAHGSRVSVSDSTQGTANFYYISGASSAITAGNPASGAMNELNLRIERDYGNASDTLGGRIRLYYVVIEYTESTDEPAALP